MSQDNFLQARGRSVRTRLNVISIIALFMVIADAKPMRFTFLDIKFAAEHGNIIICFFKAIIFAMLVEFICHAIMWKEAQDVSPLLKKIDGGTKPSPDYVQIPESCMHIIGMHRKIDNIKARKLNRLAHWVSVFIEIFLPMILAVAALILLYSDIQ